MSFIEGESPTRGSRDIRIGPSLDPVTSALKESSTLTSHMCDGADYACGCKRFLDENFGRSHYKPCDKHGQKDCGCYTFGGYCPFSRVCIKHKLLFGSIALLFFVGFITLL